MRRTSGSTGYASDDEASASLGVTAKTADAQSDDSGEADGFEEEGEH